MLIRPHSAARRAFVCSPIRGALRLLLLPALLVLGASGFAPAPAATQKPSDQPPKAGGQIPEDMDAALRLLREKVDAANELATSGDPVHAGRILMTIMEELSSYGLPAEHATANEIALEAGRAAHRAKQYPAVVRAWSWLYERWKQTRPLRDDDVDRLLATYAREARSNRDAWLALGLQRDLLERRKTYLGADDPGLLATTRDLIDLLVEVGDDEGALELLEDYHERQTARLAEDHADLMAARERLANVRFRLGDFEGAAQLFRQILDTVEANREPGDMSIQVTRQNLLHVLYAAEDLRAAIVEEEQGVLFLEVASGVDSVRLLSARRSLAGSLFGLGDLPRARRLLERVALEQAQAFPEGDLHLAETRLNLAETLRRMGYPELALPLEESAVLAMDSDVKKDPRQHEWLRRVSLQSVAESALALGRFARAREAAEAALALGVVDLADELHLRELSARALRGLGQIEPERALRLETLAGASATGAARTLAQVEPQLGFAAHLLAAGELGEARRVVDLALAEIETLGGPEVAQRREALGLQARIAARGEDAARLERALTETARAVQAALARSANPRTPWARGEDLAELVIGDLATLVELAPKATDPALHVAQAFEGLETRRARLVHGPAGARLDLAEVRARLGEARVVAYHTLPVSSAGAAKSHVWAFVWEPGGARCVDLGASSALEAAIAAWRGAAGAERDAARNALVERLVAPLALEPDAGPTFVVPDGVLHGLPLHRLFGEGTRLLASLLPAGPLPAAAGPVARIGTASFPAGADDPALALAQARGVELRSLAASDVNRVTLARALRGAGAALFELAPGAEAPELAARVRAKLAHPGAAGFLRPERPEGISALDLGSLLLPGRQALVDSLGKRIDRLEGRDLALVNLSAAELCIVAGAPAQTDPVADAFALAAVRQALHAAGARAVLMPLAGTSEERARFLGAFLTALSQGATPHAAFTTAGGHTNGDWVLSERP